LSCENDSAPSAKHGDDARPTCPDRLAVQDHRPKDHRAVGAEEQPVKHETWSAIEAIFAKHPVMKAEPVDYEQIDAAADAAGFQLPEDYREFIHRYGGAIVGPLPIIGLRQAQAMARTESSVFEVTKHFRQQGWRGVSEWLVVSVDHAGNPIA